MPEDGVFAIEFIHSVNQSPVREIFRAEGTAVRPLAVRFFSFGAGMEAEPGEGRVLSRDGDALVITGFTGSFDELNYIAGTVSDHLLFIDADDDGDNGKKSRGISLRELCGRNAHVTLRISPLGGKDKP